jgi:hypothetical protein
VLQRIQLLGTHATNSIWLLVMTHTNQEHRQSCILTTILTRSSWCRGVRAVVERRTKETAHAALDFHRLHFPHVSHDQRATRILVLGSVKERGLFI